LSVCEAPRKEAHNRQEHEMTTRANDLAYLSRRTHAEAEARNEKVPADWPEFGHYPFGMDDEGTPYVDGTRMRPDQVEDAIAELERWLGLRSRASDTYTLVRDFMVSYGVHGVRVADVVEETRVSKRRALVALQALVTNGAVIVKTEATRGSGSRRKRYFWAVENGSITRDERYIPADEDGMLFAEGKQAPNGDTGIRYHGTAVQGVTCGCMRCTAAFEAGLVGEIRSAARKGGDRRAAFEAGLELRRIRRERQVAADVAVLA